MFCFLTYYCLVYHMCLLRIVQDSGCVYFINSGYLLQKLNFQKSLLVQALKLVSLTVLFDSLMNFKIILRAALFENPDAGRQEARF